MLSSPAPGITRTLTARLITCAIAMAAIDHAAAADSPNPAPQLIEARYELAAMLAIIPQRFDREELDEKLVPLKETAERVRHLQDEMSAIAEDDPDRHVEIMNEYRERLELAQNHLHEQMERLVGRSPGHQIAGEVTRALYRSDRIPYIIRTFHRDASLRFHRFGRDERFARIRIQEGEQTVFRFTTGHGSGLLSTAKPGRQTVYLILPQRIRPGDTFTVSVEDGTLALDGIVGYLRPLAPDPDATAEVEILSTRHDRIVARLDLHVPYHAIGRDGEAMDWPRDAAVNHRGNFIFTRSARR